MEFLKLIARSLEFEDKIRHNDLPSVTSCQTDFVKPPKKDGRIGRRRNPLLPVCQQFRDALKIVGLNQVQFAKKIGHSTPLINQIYHLQNLPTKAVISKMQSAFDKLGHKVFVEDWFYPFNCNDYSVPRLHFAFRQTGLSQVEFARKAGMHPVRLCGMLTGTYKQTDGVIERMQRVFDTLNVDINVELAVHKARKQQVSA